MTANELVVVGRLAKHYEENGLARDQDPLEAATHDFKKLKKEAPRLWQHLHEDRSLTDRQIGDWLYKFFVRAVQSGISFKNFAADEIERLKA